MLGSIQKIIRFIIVFLFITTISIAKDYVLFVGVGEFKSSKLFSTIDISSDVTIVKEALYYQLEADHNITELINEKATKRDILSTLNSISQKVTEDDRVFFYYIGYATTHSDDKLWRYIRKLKRDERDFLTNSVAIVPYDFDENNIKDTLIVSSYEFAPLIQKIEQKSQLVILIDAYFLSLKARGENFYAYFRGVSNSFKNTTIISSPNRTTMRSNNSSMTKTISKCFKQKKYKRCISKSSTSDIITIKEYHP